MFPAVWLELGCREKQIWAGARGRRAILRPWGHFWELSSFRILCIYWNFSWVRHTSTECLEHPVEGQSIQAPRGPLRSLFVTIFLKNNHCFDFSHNRLLWPDFIHCMNKITQDHTVCVCVCYLGLASFIPNYVCEFLPCCCIDLGYTLEAELTGLGDPWRALGQTTSPLWTQSFICKMGLILLSCRCCSSHAELLQRAWNRAELLVGLSLTLRV